MAQANQRPGELITAINVTPLVDVVLVLLIVLMVSASYTVSQALPLELPKASSGQNASHPMAISIDESGALFLDAAPISRQKLKDEVARRKAAGEKSAMIAADGRVRHHFVVATIDLLRNAGITQFAINVAPDDLK